MGGSPQPSATDRAVQQLGLPTTLAVDGGLQLLSSQTGHS